MAVGEYVGTTYQQIQQAVTDYYGSGSDAWARIYAGAGGYYSPDAANVIKQVPGVTVTYSNSGKVLGYSYANPFASSGNGASVIDSNAQTGVYGSGSFTNSIPSTVVDNGQGQLVAQSGSRLTSTGATVATVVDRLSLAAVGVSLGTKLGKAIDSGIYSLAPDWWDEHYPNINPETWDDMAITQGGRQFIQGIFGLQSDTTTMYMDERLLAQTYMMLIANGAYSGSHEVIPPDQYPSGLSREMINNMPNPLVTSNHVKFRSYVNYDVYNSGTRMTWLRSPADGMGYNPTEHIIMASESPFTATFMRDNSQTTATAVRRVVGDKTFYYVDTYTWRYNNQITVEDGYCNVIRNNISIDATTVAYTLLYGTPTSGGLDGVNDDGRAQTHIDPTLITGSTPAQVLQQLKTNYPELFDGSIYQDTPQEDGTVDHITYIPVPIPDGVATPTPTTGQTSQNNPSVNPVDTTESLLDQIVQILSHPETQPQTDTTTNPPSDTPTPPDTGDGDTPLIPPVTGSASSLWKIYNPSQSELDAFGAWLWSSNFIDQLKKLFNDPMQAIIGVHKVFCSPSIGGTATIKCGYLDSEVSSNWVSNQYTHIDCGTVNLPEYFGNVFDYDPFTRVSLFLPCIGIVPLDVAEVMRSSISVKLHCDVITGALLAEVNVIRDQAGGILYTYSGSCIVTYPVSSGTYVGAVANVVSVAASVAAGIMGTVASGGALAPAAVGAAGAAVSGLAHTRTNVQHSGSFSGAAGVMGGKIPYLIITRPQTRMADNYPEYDGVPANFTSRLGDCTGYVKVKEVHLKVSNAYQSEIAEIEQLLHQGVLI